MKSGAVFIDNSTISADVARQIWDSAKERNIAALDAPVSGGQAGAENGKLTVMVGGDTAAFDTAAADAMLWCNGCAYGRIWHRATNQNGQSDLHCRPCSGAV